MAKVPAFAKAFASRGRTVETNPPATTAMRQPSSANSPEFFNSLLVLLCHKLAIG
jgi:hypothetical protein